MAKNFKYETFPDFVKSKELSDTLQIPYTSDALPIWKAFKQFFHGFVELYYEKEEDVETDQELKDFWVKIQYRGNLEGNDQLPTYGLPELSKESLKNYLTHLAFSATAWHEHVGLSPYMHYLGNRRGMSFKVHLMSYFEKPIKD